MDKIKAGFRELRQRYPWIDHVIRAYGQYKFNQGDHQAAAITFFSFLSIFPLILLGVSVTGYVLAGNPDLQNSFINAIVSNIPGQPITRANVQTVIDNRGATGIVGIISLALTGTGWVDNIRSAMESVWGRRPSSRSFLVAKGGDLVILVLLGISLAVAFGITGFGTTLTDVLLSPLGLDDAGWAAAVALVLGLALAVAWDTAAFTVILMRLPRIEVQRRSAIKGSLFAAVGFEILLVGGSYYLSVLSNPAAAVFGSVIGLLVWLNLVSRFLLFCAAWTSTLPAEAGTSPVLAVLEAADDAGEGAALPHTGRPVTEVSPAAVGAGLVGAGAALGAAGVGAGRLYRRRRRRSSTPNARTKSTATPV